MENNEKNRKQNIEIKGISKSNDEIITKYFQSIIDSSQSSIDSDSKNENTIENRIVGKKKTGSESILKVSSLYNKDESIEDVLQDDIEMGKVGSKLKRFRKTSSYRTHEHHRKYFQKIGWLFKFRGFRRIHAGTEKHKTTTKPQKRSSLNQPSTKAIQKDAKELIRFYIKRHITLIFWVRLGARICMGLLYIAMAKCEHDLMATVLNQQNSLCIKHYENLEPVEDLLTIATLPIIPDFFMGALGILPLYRLYNDPFVIGYNLIIAILCIWTGISVRGQLVKCGEMVTNLITYSANILICMGFFHFIPFFISFLMIRKGEELFFINRFLHLFKNPPEEGHWWSLPRLPPVDFVNIELLDKKLETKV